MAQSTPPVIQNNFTAGLKTEYTGLNFPENAATDTANCLYTLTGDVLRRYGINFELGFSTTGIDRTNFAVNTFLWTNVGGDGNTQILVLQVGQNLFFYQVSLATAISPPSRTLLSTIIGLGPFLVNPSDATNSTFECQFADGNGTLIVFHPQCNPFYITYVNGIFTTTGIDVQIRDTDGLTENIPDSQRVLPINLTSEHLYNLANQGWGKFWNLSSTTTATIQTGPILLNVTPTTVNIPLLVGDRVRVYSGSNYGTITPPTSMVGFVGVITSFSANTIAINSTIIGGSGSHSDWSIVPEPAYDQVFNNALGYFPSNSDVWSSYKNINNDFDPATTANSVTTNSGPAPRGYYILDAFNQNRNNLYGLAGITSVTTVKRPSTGAWFQGRAWYAGVNASQPKQGDAAYYTWSESIYFSQIIQTPDMYGMCYQSNDPTSDTLFDLLPSDGGVIKIQGSGAIFKLFPVTNGILVFAANGIWFITGSQGLGFTATDYTISKISSVKTVSGTPFVDVLGFPTFWTQEAIYSVQPGRENAPYGFGGFIVTPITLKEIDSYYNAIPFSSVCYARGSYNPITYTIQWIFKSTQETSITDRYQFDTILNYNTQTKSFFPYILGKDGNTTIPYIHAVDFISYPSPLTAGTVTPIPTFKYISSIAFQASFKWTFAEEFDTSYTDWNSVVGGGVDYISFFKTGYNLHGLATRRWQPVYLYIFSRNTTNNSYEINGVWDFASDPRSNRFSIVQNVENNNRGYFSMFFKRHKIRGRGLALQYELSSVTGKPFYFMGWSVVESANTGP